MRPTSRLTRVDLEAVLAAVHEHSSLTGPEAQLYSRLETWLRAVERARAGALAHPAPGSTHAAVPQSTVDVLQTWASSLVGLDAHPDWQIEAGVAVLEIYMRRRLEL